MRRRLLVLVVVLACAPARAQEEDDEPLDLRHAVALELERYADAADDPETRALCVARLGSWLVTRAAQARPALGVAPGGAASAVRDALLAAATPLPALDELPPGVGSLLAALAEAPTDDPLVEAARFLRFVDALDRAPELGATLDALPEHAWVRAARAMFARRAAVEEVAAALERLGQPDPASAERCRVVYLGDAWSGASRTESILTVTGWRLPRDEAVIEVFTDTLRRERIEPWPAPPEVQAVAGGPLPRVEASDALDEARRWLLEPRDAYDDFTGDPGTLAYRPATLVRAAWALRAGRPLLASMLARLAEHDAGADNVGEVVAATRLELAANRWQAAVEALFRGAPRADVVPLLDLAAWLLESAAERDGQRVFFAEDVDDLRQRAVDLRAAVAAQAEADRRRPVAPTWATWQAWSPAERVACALDHLRDQAAKQWMQPGACDPLDSEQTFPPGAPARASPADRLIELGDAAIPVLIERITDGSPTRCVEFHRDFAAESWDVLPLGDVAVRALRVMLGPGGLRRPDAATWAGRAEQLQAQARDWLARWGPRGGLGAWYEARLAAEVEPGSRVGHALALLRYDPARARAALPPVVPTLDDPCGLPGLLRTMADTGDPAYAEVYRRELASTDEQRVAEAACGLVRLGDPAGLAAARELAAREAWVWPDLLVRLAQAGAREEAGRLLLALTDRCPGRDWELRVRLSSDGASLLPPDAALAMGRLAVREEHGVVDLVLEDLATLCGGGGDRAAAVVAALTSDVGALRRADRAEHAAATVLSLGLDAVRTYEARGGPPVRPLLLAALRSGDPARQDPFDDALGRAGPQVVAWATEGADGGPQEEPSEAPRRADRHDPSAPEGDARRGSERGSSSADPTDGADRARLRDASGRASLRVRQVEEVGHDLHEDRSPCVLGWGLARWDPASVAPLVAAWRERGRGAGLEVTIERAEDLRGVTVRARTLERASAGLVVEVRAPGLERDGPLDEAELGPLLRRVADALAADPGAPAAVRVVLGR